MRPPICAICDKRLEEEEMKTGGLVSFAKSENDLAWDKRAEEPGFVGHPPYLEWFCEKHYPKARSLSHLTRAEAMKEMRE